MSLSQTAGGNTINKADIRIYYSSYAVGNASYLGGSRTNEELSDNYLHNFFQRTTNSEQITGITKYRCGYIYNANPNAYIKNPILYIVSNTTSPNDSVSVGWGKAIIGTGIQGNSDPLSIEQTILNENTIPEGVEFFDGNTRSTGAILGADIPPLKCKPFWIEYFSTFNAQDFPRNTFVLRMWTDNVIRNVTTTPGLQKATVTFPVISECAGTTAFTQMLGFIFQQKPDFILTAGNNNIEANPTSFLNPMNPYIQKLAIAFGNRDVLTQTETNAYVNALAKYNFVNNLDRKYYSFDIGNVHILVMDTSGSSPYNNPSTQYTFVVNDLKAASTNTATDWIIVVTNRAMYSSQTTSAIRLLYTDLRDTYHKIFTDNNVLFVLQGTYHFYERSKVLGYNAASPSAPTTADLDGPAIYHISGKKSFPNGQIYINTGTGGGLIDVVSLAAPYSQVRDAGDTGYVLIKADNTGSDKKITVRYYATSRTTQVFVDQFTIIRTG